jgi:hypothetical protein
MGGTQMVKYLPSRHETLSSNPSPAKKNLLGGGGSSGFYLLG